MFTMTNDHAPWLRDHSVAPDAPAVVAAVPDRYDAQRHTLKSDGTVARRGRAHVVGAMHWDETAPLFGTVASDVRQALAEYLERADARADRNDAHQVDAVTLTRWADALVGAHIPRLMGTDAVSWEQVVHAGDGTTDDARIAHHNPSDPIAAAIPYGLDLSPDRRWVRLSHPTRGARRISAGGTVRYVTHTDTVRDGLLTAVRASTFRPTLKRHPVRYSLP